MQRGVHTTESEAVLAASVKPCSGNALRAHSKSLIKADLMRTCSKTTSLNTPKVFLTTACRKISAEALFANVGLSTFFIRFDKHITQKQQV